MALTEIPIELSSTPGIVDNSNATAITIDSSENVGIRTTSPDAPLEIDGGSTDSTVLHLTSGTANTYLKLSDSNTTNGGFIGYTTEDMSFWANNTRHMTLTSTGNLLLGTSSVIGGAGGSGAQIFLKQAASSNGVSSVANSNNNYVRMLHTGTAGKVEPTYGTGGSYTPLAFFTGGSEHMRLETAGNLNLLDGNLIFAAGHGVDFSANPHSGQRTSELLDDYEEGTWTPTIFAVGGGTVTGITVGQAYYTKVGRNVNIYLYISSINLAQLTTGTYVCLGGLPFTCNGYSDFNFTYMRGGTTIRGGYAQTSSNYIYLCDDAGYESQQASNHLLTHMIGACAYMTNS
jgi:hypothetical protein